jgi:large subunit ribosomal protein L14e
MIEIGRVCIKKTGRESDKKCVIVDVIDENFVLIDGNVKRRKCNINHLIPTHEKLEIEKGASTEHIKHAMKKAGLLEEPKVSHIKKRERKKGAKPKKGAKKKEAAAKKGAKHEKKKPAKKKTEDEIVEEALAKV